MLDRMECKYLDIANSIIEELEDNIFIHLNETATKLVIFSESDYYDPCRDKITIKSLYSASEIKKIAKKIHSRIERDNSLVRISSNKYFNKNPYHGVILKLKFEE